MSTTENTFVDEGERVIIYDELAKNVIYDLFGFGDCDAEEKSFLEAFEVVSGTHLAAEDYYQGLTVMSVIKRKSDGRLFGFEWWKDISKHGEDEAASNGDQHGLEFDVPAGFDWNSDYYPSPFVYLPIEPFTITGYKITNEGSN